MKKVFLPVILCLVLILGTVNVNADTVFSNVSYNVDYVDNALTLSFDTDFPLTRGLLVVLNPGKALGDIVSDPIASLQYQAEVLTDEDGNVSKTFLLNLKEEPTATLKFDVYAKILGNTAEKIATAAYKSQADRSVILNKLKGTATEIKSVFSDTEALASLGMANLSFLNELDINALALNMQGKFSGYSDTKEGFSQAANAVREFCVTELLNQNKKSIVFDADGKYLLENLLSFSEYDKNNSTTFYNCYNTLIKKDACIEISNSLLSKNFESPLALYKKFAELTVLKGLPNPKTTGYGHIEDLLSASNRAFVGLDIYGVIDGDIEAQISSASEFSTLEALKGYIQGLINNKNYNPGGSFTGGVTSGGSFSGGSTIKAEQGYVEKQEPQKDTVVFKDVTDEHWAIEAIAYLKSKGIINGTGDNNFEPDSPVTREQLIKMVFAISKIQIEENYSVDFEDVEKDSWYAPYIASAVKAGYINGFSETEFGVGHYATRQDICTILNRILEIETDIETEFIDKAEISDYAVGAINALSSEKIINGYPDGSFGPLKNCTRAEVAAILYRAVEFSEVK